MAFLGFQATMTDGAVVRESDATWDAVPHGVQRVALYEDWQKEVAALDGGPGRRLYFTNECVCGRGGYGVLSAKTIGCVDGDLVTEIRVESTRAALLAALSSGVPPALDLVSKRHFHVSELSLSDAALRRAA